MTGIAGKWSISMYKYISLIIGILCWVYVGCETDLTRTIDKDTDTEDSSQSSSNSVIVNDQLDLGSAEVVGYLVSLDDSYTLQYLQHRINLIDEMDNSGVKSSEDGSEPTIDEIHSLSVFNL